MNENDNSSGVTKTGTEDIF